MKRIVYYHLFLLFFLGEMVPAITVITPNGGERWISGIKQTISWRGFFRGSGAVANIVLLKDGVVVGSIGQCRDRCNRADGTATFNWTVGQGAEGGWFAPNSEYKIRISYTGMAGSQTIATDESDAPFVIGIPELVSPNGGENWILGERKQIIWRGRLGSMTTIMLFRDDRTVGMIDRCRGEDCLGPDGTGIREWTVGEIKTPYGDTSLASPGPGYKVRIGISDTGLLDQSDGPFSIILFFDTDRFNAIKQIRIRRIPTNSPPDYNVEFEIDPIFKIGLGSPQPFLVHITRNKRWVANLGKFGKGIAANPLVPIRLAAEDFLLLEKGGSEFDMEIKDENGQILYTRKINLKLE